MYPAMHPDDVEIVFRPISKEERRGWAREIIGGLLDKEKAYDIRPDGSMNGNIDKIIEGILKGIEKTIENAKKKGTTIAPTGAGKPFTPYLRPCNMIPGKKKGNCQDTMIVMGARWEEVLENLRVALMEMFIRCLQDNRKLTNLNCKRLTHHRLVVFAGDWHHDEAERKIMPFLKHLPRHGISGHILLHAGDKWHIAQF